MQKGRGRTPTLRAPHGVGRSRPYGTSPPHVAGHRTRPYWARTEQRLRANCAQVAAEGSHAFSALPPYGDLPAIRRTLGKPVAPPRLLRSPRVAGARHAPTFHHRTGVRV